MSASLAGLRARRLVVVHGKGGVGRTTVSAALTLALARAGRAAVGVEIGGEDGLAQAFGYDAPAYAPRTPAPSAAVRSLSVEDCLADFGARKLRMPALARWFFTSRLMTGFVEAVPGLTDVIQLGKIEDMLNHPLAGEPVWDVGVLDAPATGHGLTLVGAARSMAELTRVGPFFDLARIIERFLSDGGAVSHVVVTLPELLPVSESLQLVAALTADHAAPAAVILNQRGTGPARGPADDALAAALREADEPALAALHDALRAAEAREAEAEAVLREGLKPLGVPVVTLPRLGNGPVGPAALAPLTAALAAALGAP